MTPFYNMTGPQYVLGMPCSQNRWALPAWSYAIEKHCPRRIVEIGSGTGGFTIALATALKNFNKSSYVISYDITAAPSEDLLPKCRDLAIGFNTMDVHAAKGAELVAQWIQAEGLTFLLCDGGNKALEFELFAPMLKPGDVIAAHDYMTCTEYWGWSEISLEQGELFAHKNNLSRWLPEVFDPAAWLVYRKNL